MHRSFRFRLYPTPAQAETLGQWVGATRFVYNLALEQRRDFWRQFKANEGQHISLASQARELTQTRACSDWLAAAPQVILEAALNDLDKAFRAFFKSGTGYPQFRRLGLNDSARFRAREVKVRTLNGRWSEVKIPKMGWVRFRSSRATAGKHLTVTVKRIAGEWFVTFANAIGDAPALISALPVVGVDRGVTNTLSLSTGEHIGMADMTKLERRRRKAQRVLARRKRGSRRHAAQRRRVGRIAAKIARVRAHALHKASTSIVRRFGVVALEDLKIRSMTASAKGTAEAPGKGVAAKRGLNRAILAQGWGIFAEMLEYKLEAAGGRLVYVPAPYTSQTCHACGVIDARSRESQASFACVHCGHRDHADTNAALEILRRSTAVVEGRGTLRPVEASTLAA